MCGIAGLLNLDRERPVDPVLLDRMTDALAHRGPDGRGARVDGSLGLGHRRLTVVASDDGAQPLTGEDASVWVVCDGELYNAGDLRAELEAAGHRFRSAADGEVLIHLYEEEGEDLVARLRGTFAFALWDGRARRLVLARDRFGQKPLYYRLTEEGLHFGSEIKAILQDPAVARVPDPVALHHYLTFGYVPAPRTAFAGIQKLPPGHTLTLEADGARRLRRYWRLTWGPKLELSEAAAAERLLELLDEATRLRMASEVPLGALLSGDLASSAVAASMCAVSRGGAGVRTLGLGDGATPGDEPGRLAAVAHHLGTHHTPLVLPDAAAPLDRIAWHCGEPLADPSCLTAFAAAALARQHVAVALTGDGADELLGAHPRYLGTWLEERLRRASRAARAPARSRLLIQLLRRAGASDLSGELAHNRSHRAAPPSDLYLTRVESLPPALKRELYSDDFLAETRGRDARDLLRRALAHVDGETFTERCAGADAVTELPDDVLVRADAASMAHGLQRRAPFLDHVLAEFMARLPFRHKIRRTRTQVVLARAMARRLPRSLLEPRRSGAAASLERWLGGGLAPLLEETVLSRRALERGYFRPSAVRRLVDEHTRGAGDHQRALFSLLMLETWHRQFVDAPAAVAAG